MSKTTKEIKKALFDQMGKLDRNEITVLEAAKTTRQAAADLKILVKQLKEDKAAAKSIHNK